MMMIVIWMVVVVVIVGKRVAAGIAGEGHGQGGIGAVVGLGMMTTALALAAGA